MFVIRNGGLNLWTVGCFFPPYNEWTQLKDCATVEEAMAWINYLNGGTGCVPGGYRFTPRI